MPLFDKKKNKPALQTGMIGNHIPATPLPTMGESTTQSPEVQRLTDTEREEISGFYKILCTLKTDFIREEDEPQWLRMAQLLTDKRKDDWITVPGAPMVKRTIDTRHKKRGKNGIKKLIHKANHRSVKAKTSGTGAKHKLLNF